MKTYAGIGARKTPPQTILTMQSIGKSLYDKGILLQSGGALGADQAFASKVPTTGKKIYRPEHNTPESYTIAKRFHPAWDRCSDYVKALHGRNSLILLGDDCNAPVDFVICWTPKAQPVGGTGQALRIAYHYNITVFNIADNSQLTALRELFKTL